MYNYLDYSWRGAALPLAVFFLPLFAGLPPLTAQRLENSVTPEHYTITLAPDLKAATFTGREVIDVAIHSPTDSITLNAIEITFQSVRIAAGGKEETALVAVDKNKQQAVLSPTEPIPAGSAKIEIEFTGILNQDQCGFYLSNGPRRSYAVTQFEAVDARRAFPCFDEPALKATFDVSLVVDSTDTAIANMPVASDTPGPGDGKHTLSFQTTPKMSTYLLVFLVGDLQCVKGKQDGVRIGVCSTADKAALTAYGLDVAKYVLHYYNTYFGIPYPLPKLDLIALPDFAAGAMENFGAITYREDVLLLDPSTASVSSKKEVASVIAHEMAHQWFGDMVTMQWWDNLWLNEGFATWMANKPLAAMHPEWNIDEAVVSDTDWVLDFDSRATTRAIRAKADSPEEINQMFEAITYYKAASVLRMVENYVGEEAFRRGVREYLTAHLYGNATAEDFWGAQAHVSHKPVDRIMESLVSQPGVPVLTFGEPAAGKVQVAQRRFCLSPGIQADPAQKWTLPVCFKATNGNTCRLLNPEDTQLKAPAAPVFFPDAGGAGYYRTAYSAATLEALADRAETALTPPERIRLLGDQWAQLRANQTTVGEYLNLAGTLSCDSSARVIGESGSLIEMIYEQVAATPEEHEGLAAWIRATFGAHLAQLGNPTSDDSPNKRELRAELFRLLGNYGEDPAVLKQAQAIAQKYIADPASVDATLGQGALAVAARHGDAKLFDQLQKVYEASTNPELQEGALRLLAEFEDPVLVKRSLDYAVSGKVCKQDAIMQVAFALWSNPARDLTWTYMTSNWDKVQAQFAGSMGALLVQWSGNFCSTERAEEVKAFFAEHKVEDSSVGLQRAVDRINACAEFRQLQEPHLRQWLAGQS